MSGFFNEETRYGGTMNNPPEGMTNKIRKAKVVHGVDVENVRLLDMMYRFTFDKEKTSGWRSNEQMRYALMKAKRFVADEQMSSFMADLANVAFLKVTKAMKRPRGDTLYKIGKAAIPILQSLRVQSRLPHESIWVEYKMRKYQERSSELREDGVTDFSETPLMEGWLIQQHPVINTAHIMHIFTADPSHIHDDGFNFWTYPFCWAWTTDDSELPWKKTFLGYENEDLLSQIGTGVAGYISNSVGIVQSPLLNDFVLGEKGRTAEYAQYLITEWTGHVRRAWALLATIENLPLRYSEARVAKSFLAKGMIRKGLAHKTITLNIPAKLDVKVLARKAVAAAHRKRHGVRGHWRNHHWHLPSKSCDPHLWECLGDDADTIQCTTCKGQQVYVHPHERGDESLGRVEHNYELRHP